MKEGIKELRGFHWEQSRFLALHIPALNKLKKEFRLTHNELTLLAVIHFLTRTGKGTRVYKQQMKNFLGDWQRAYLLRKLKHLEDHDLIISREILNIRYYSLTNKGEHVLKKFNFMMAWAYGDYLKSKKAKNAM